MAIIVLFQCDPWCLPTQKWLKNATNDISIQDFHNITRHYVKDTGVDDMDHNITQNIHIKIFLMSHQFFFEFSRTWFLSCSNMGIFDEFQILAARSRAQKKHITEFTEFSARIWKMSNLITPSAFVCIGKYFHTF
jgi:hypothetical protein